MGAYSKFLRVAERKEPTHASIRGAEAPFLVNPGCMEKGKN